MKKQDFLNEFLAAMAANCDPSGFSPRMKGLCSQVIGEERPRRAIRERPIDYALCLVEVCGSSDTIRLVCASEDERLQAAALALCDNEVKP